MSVLDPNAPALAAGRASEPEWVDQEQLTRAQKALLALSGDVAKQLAEDHGVCVRPMAMRRLETSTGRVDVVVPDRAEVLLVFGQVAPARVAAPNPSLTFRIEVPFPDDVLEPLGANRADVAVQAISRLLFVQANVVSVDTASGDVPEITRAYVADESVIGVVEDSYPLVFGEVEVNPAMILHGEQSISCHRTLPPRAEVEIRGQITEVWDKGKAAVLGFEGTASDGDGDLFTASATLFVRGAGGFGGERGPSTTGKNQPPGRDPDIVI